MSTADAAPPSVANVLLVDDQPANLLALEATLEGLGPKLVRATSGREALRRLAEDDFAVVLLDVQLHGFDGFETAQLVRAQERSRHTPIIFLTAYETPTFPAEKAYTLGAVDYLVRPFAPVILRSKVQVFVDLYHKAEQVKRQAEQLRLADRRDFERRLAEENDRLRQSERRFRALVENAWDGISLVAADGRIVQNIPDNLHHLGYETDEFVGHNGFEFVHPEDAPAVQAAMARLLQTPGSRETMQYRLRRKDGSWRWVEGTGTNLLAEPGVGAIVVNYHDVTERRQADEERGRLLDELTRRVGELGEANRHKEEFLAMLAHELRNPLAPLCTSLHVARQPGADRRTRERALETMGRQVRDLTNIVNDLLDVSRLRRNKVALKVERLDLAHLVRTCAEDHAPALREKGLALRLEVAALPLWVDGDPTRLRQVLGNLLGNAGKFTEAPGAVTVAVRAAAEAGRAEVAVRDTGSGIEPELVPRLCEPFVQADRTLARSRGGLGLGLALVKGLVELHGGGVAVASEGSGRGTAVTFWLPRASGERTPPQPSRPPPAPAGPVRVLVVEDNRDSADVLQALLELNGYRVSVAYDGPEGVAAALRLKPDVLLCDIGLPGMDGYQVARTVRDNPDTAGVRLIALTGYGRDEDRRRAEEAGFDLHLTKPVDPEQLRQHLTAGEGDRPGR